MVLIVAEPSISGISDMKRIVKTANIFHTKIAVCINKSDTNLLNSEKIEDFCTANTLPFVGRIPFDPAAVKAINSGLTIVDAQCPSGFAAKEVFSNTMKLLYK
jgi:MinD superfamily P-loop ATPase